MYLALRRMQEPQGTTHSQPRPFPQLPFLGGPREVIMGRLLGAHQRVVEQRHQRQVLRPLGHPQRRLGQCPKAQRRTVSLARGPALLA